MIDWNGCLNFDGQEKNAPIGSESTIKNFRAMNLVTSIDVLDVANEDGFSTKLKKSGKFELGNDDIVIDVKVNEKAIVKLQGRYGERYLTFRKIDAPGMMTREEWEIFTRPDPNDATKLGIDVLKLEAMRQILGGKEIINIG